MNKRTISTALLVGASCLGLLATACEPAPGKPKASIADARRTEGTGGTATLAFTVTLSAPSTQVVRMPWSTADGTAEQPADYTATSGTVEFAPRSTSAVVTVPIAGDDVDEPDETFAVNLWASTTADVADGSATGTIEDDEAPPEVFLDDAPWGAETNTGSWADFPIRLSRPSSRPITITCTTVDGTAVAGQDFPVQDPCAITVPAGATRVDYYIPRLEDDVDELDESYGLRLTGAPGAVIRDAEASTTIFDVNWAPTFTVEHVDMPEGNPPTPSVARVTGRLSHRSSRDIIVDCITRPGSASPDTDYITTGGSCFGFPAGTTTATFGVTVRSDDRIEPDEAFFVEITGPWRTSAPVLIAPGTLAQVLLRNDGDTCVINCTRV